MMFDLSTQLVAAKNLILFDFRQQKYSGPTSSAMHMFERIIINNTLAGWTFFFSW